MNYSFNLIDRPWIPCIFLNGRMQEFSLRETLTHAHEIRSIQGDSSLETAAIYRLLLAIIHSALRGPRTAADWNKIWLGGQGTLDQPWLQSYLEKWRHRFDLFDAAQPFYQAADERVKPKSVISLVMDMASGNMATLFDHHTEVPGETLTTAQAARILLTAQTCSLAGLCRPGLNFTDSPWARGVVFLVEGDTLFMTLVLNLLRYPSIASIPSLSTDSPAWEKDDPYIPAREIPEGYLDYLTWPSRRVMLFSEGEENNPVIHTMTVGPGLRLDDSLLDPCKLYKKRKTEGYFSIRFIEGRALWRDSAALFSVHSTVGYRPPETFSWIKDLATVYGHITKKQTYRFMALGMANNQAKVDFIHEEHLPLPLIYLENEDLVGHLSTALDLAEQTRFALRKAGQRLALLLISPKSEGKKWQEVDRISKEDAESLYAHWAVDSYFWQQLEIPFSALLMDLPSSLDALQNWQKAVQRSAWQALDQAAAYAGTDAAALKAAVRARGSLGYSLNEIFSEIKKETIV
jgi:CRISPR system Cascade subunit CasA